ncbi:MAG: amidohydrolase [Bacteroidia bacterium]|nr:amidohydrolase [Bacteroidia bacterium]
MDHLIKTIKQKAHMHFENVVAHRRHLHMHPELSFKEEKTAAYIQNQLTQLAIPFKTNIGGHGVVALIEGKNASVKTVALRADMDALPITEINEVSYKSKNNGVMHACGHDAHTASLLGVAAILNEMKNEFDGTVKLIFQPAEEKLPGGASLMIADGVLKNPAPASIIGQHVMPMIEVGKVGFRSGIYMASTDELYMTIKGKGGHGAMPHLNVDPVLIMAHILIALQQIVSRNANPTMPSVLSFGKVSAPGATNVIPDEVKLEGTFRTLDENWRTEAHKRMVHMASTLAASMGGSCELKIVRGYPALINEPQLTARMRQFAVAYLGSDNVVDLDIWMAAEDFAYYSQVAHACFYRLGTRNTMRGITSSVHTPTFDIDETALQIGAGLMAYSALRELAS